ncbi:probable glutathione S-transferase 9 [Montipora capricornis]|uniref:probable glutathione S-transferase 9 n=1 Tax=Montipora capricornis TaxID=246305 RepID=UPI0035F10E25
MSGYKLYYFEGRARAEVCRLSFAAANIAFEDIRLKREDWVKEKASGRPPLGQMPFIVTPEEKCLAQSGAIMKYICKMGGLCPSDSFDEARADMITDGVADLRTAFYKFKFEANEEKQATLEKEFFESTLPSRLEKFSALLQGTSEGKAFFFDDKLTYADITFFDFFNSILGGEKEAPKELDKFPLLKEHYYRVLNVPEIKAWVENRPKTDF